MLSYRFDEFDCKIKKYSSGTKHMQPCIKWESLKLSKNKVKDLDVRSDANDLHMMIEGQYGEYVYAISRINSDVIAIEKLETGKSEAESIKTCFIKIY
jgi:hypothetical protein